MTHPQHPPRLDARHASRSELEPLELARSRMPSWLLGARPEIIEALSAAMAKSHSCHARVAQKFGALKSVEQYCGPLLSAELLRHFGPLLDIERDRLEVAHVRWVPSDTLLLTRRPETQYDEPKTLLWAALQNFSANEALERGFNPLSSICLAGELELRSLVLPYQFAAVCRNLDLGLKYQRYLQDHLGVAATGEAHPSAAQLATLNTLRQLKNHNMEVDAHIAFLKKDISQTAYTALLAVIRQDLGEVPATPVLLDGRPLFQSSLSILDVAIDGVVVFLTDTLLVHPTNQQAIFTSQSNRLVVYVPNDPVAPFREYSSLEVFTDSLKQRLAAPDYQGFFASFIALSARGSFFQQINAKPWSLGLQAWVLGTSAAHYLSSVQLKKMFADALVLAVPTGVLDEREREAKWQLFKSAGLFLVNMASLFVPGLGELMLAVAAGQMLKEVFEGIEDWSRGDIDNACKHLLNVAKDIAMTVTVALGVGVIKKGISSLSSASHSFFEGFEPVEIADKTPRLWNKSLATYESKAAPHADIKADAQGFISIEGQRHVQVDGKHYRVTHDPLLKQWRIVHPQRAKAFQPPLLHNNEGAWQHSHERPREWQGSATLLGRLREDASIRDERTLEQIRALTDTHEDLLRRVHLDNLAAPPLLKVSLKRFEIDRQISAFIASMNGPGYNAANLADLQLGMLPRLAGWPAGKALRLVDDAGQPLTQYSNPQWTSSSTIDLAPSVLTQEKLLATVLKGLSSAQLRTLIGEGAGRSSLPEQTLARQLGAYAVANRSQLFEHLYERFNVSVAAEAKPIETAFPGLPRPVAQTLAENATDAQREQLRAAKVPLALAELARWHLRDARLNRAFEGFYLDAMSNADTEALALHFLPRLPGWPAEAVIEIREDSVWGNVRHKLGAATTDKPGVLIKTAQGYQRYSARGAVYSLEPDLASSLPRAVFQSLTQSQRRGLGFPLLSDALAFNTALADRAVLARAESAGVLGMQPIKPGFKPPALFTEGQRGYPLCGFDAGAHSRNLQRRVRALYPTFDDERVVEYLDALVEARIDPLSLLRARKREERALLKSLQNWVDNTTLDLPDAEEVYNYADNRYFAARLIIHAWHKGVKHAPWITPVGGQCLNLDGLRVGNLLRLPSEVDLSHIQELSLNNIGSKNLVAEFLEPFSGVVSLEMDNNRLTHLPVELQRMPHLSRLSMVRNSVSLTPPNVAVLNQLHKLEVLNLNHNPLGSEQVLDLNNMESLRRVYLRRTGISQWPDGLITRPLLEVADLRGNRIVDIPEQVYLGTAALTRNTSLSGNPLSASTRLRLARHVMQGGSSLGINSEDMMSEAAAFEFWSAGITNHERLRREGLWNHLRADPASEDFFSVVGRLSTTADSQIIRQDLTRRVWEMIEAANESALLRRNLFDVAAAPRGCTDSVALSFSSMEIQVLLHDLPDKVATQESEMLALARGLFRLDKLEKIAAQTSAQQVLEGGVADEVEVHLAYRIGLAKPLKLPRQPVSMVFKVIAGVTQQDLDLAQAQVQMAEKTSALVEFVSELDFWRDYLVQKHYEEYQVLTESYHLRLSELLRKSPDMTSERYMSEIKVIRSEMDATVQVWLRDKTRAILALSMDQLSGAWLTR